jgi:hypothetical protein
MHCELIITIKQINILITLQSYVLCVTFCLPIHPSMDTEFIWAILNDEHHSVCVGLLDHMVLVFLIF